MKTRKIRVSALASQEAAIREKYEVKDGSPDTVIEFEIEVEDDSKNLKLLSRDPMIKDWEDIKKPDQGLVDTTSWLPGQRIAKIAEVPIQPKNLETLTGVLVGIVDFTEPKDLVSLCSKTLLNVSKISGSDASFTKTPGSVAYDSIVQAAQDGSQADPALSYELTKVILKTMASHSKKEFKEKFVKHLYDATLGITEKSKYYEVNNEIFIKTIFTGWNETN